MHRCLGALRGLSALGLAALLATACSGDASPDDARADRDDASDVSIVDDDPSARLDAPLDAPRDAPLDAPRLDARADVAEHDVRPDVVAHPDVAPVRPRLNAFWTDARAIGGGAVYVARSYTRPSTHTATPVHAVAIYFEPGPAGTAAPNLVVSNNHPCAGHYCTTRLWVETLSDTPVFAVNGDYFTGVNYGNGALEGGVGTWHLWRTAADGVITRPTHTGGAELSTSGNHIEPVMTTVDALPSNARNAIGGLRILADTMGDPAAPDYYAARTVSAVDRHGWLFVLVAEGFDHSGHESGNGLTLHDVWEVGVAMGGVQVINHDGGGSSQMYVRGHGQVYPSGAARYTANHFGVQD